jgi:hypothetical protein
MTQENKSGYEKKDVNLKFVIGISLLSIVIFVVIIVFLTDYFITEESKIVYETQLQPESVNLKDLLAEEEEILTTYKILDAEKGIYRIPIERAITLLAEK